MRNLFRSALVVGGVGAGLIMGMSPAYAAATWETAGYRPTCDVAIPTGADAYTYYDFTKPVASLSVTPTIVVGNTPKAATLATLVAKDSCSGVLNASAVWFKNGEPGSEFGGTAPTEKSHYAKFTLGGNLAVGTHGDYTFPAVIATDRAEKFSLSNNFATLEASTPRAGIETARYAFSTEKYASTHCYVLRQTTLTQSTSKTAIKKGSSVTISGKLAVANGTGFTNVTGRSVALQYKSGSTWKTAVSKATNSSGVASFTIKPSSTKTWRLSYAGNKTSLYYAPRATVGTQVRVS